MNNLLLHSSSGSRKRESNADRGTNTSSSTVQRHGNTPLTTSNSVTLNPLLLLNGAMPAYDQLVAEAEAEAERNVWKRIQRVLGDHSTPHHHNDNNSSSNNNSNNNNKRPRPIIPHYASGTDESSRVARGRLSIQEQEDLAREIIEAKRRRLMEELSLLTTTAAARETISQEQRQRASYVTQQQQQHQHRLLEQQLRREHIGHLNNRHQMDLLDNLLFHREFSSSSSSDQQQNRIHSIPNSMHPLLYRHELELQQQQHLLLQQQHHHQQPQRQEEEEVEPPQWIWHKTTDPIPIPPSQLVTKTIKATKSDPHGAAQRYISTHVAVSLPYEIAMQCDAPSLYASVKVALAKAWVPSATTTTTTGSNYNRKKNNSNNTENDLFENIAVL